ncbi:hypothetical protein ABZ372_54345, partial [Streptomyces sp. NPDC005921]
AAVLHDQGAGGQAGVAGEDACVDAEVEVAVPTRYLAHWADGWAYESGGFILRVGTSAVELPLRTTLVVSG